MALKRPESVLVVLFDQHHRILIMQREDDPEFWQSVTGTIEENERPIDAAYREVKEETGISLSPASSAIVDCQHTNRFEIRSRWLHRYPQGTRYNTEHVFCAQVDSRQPVLLTEHTQYEWVTREEAIGRLWSPSNRDAITQFVPESI
ncbi:dihydroneopterin triphosphate diphosphatase [Alteromonas sp. H39]|uniref:dihydroneopterin triphosphate diphosphatase n=1 Tax=Alteromonas sp. H39 TaxID=3389876 RepID=UPI0039E00349